MKVASRFTGHGSSAAARENSWNGVTAPASKNATSTAFLIRSLARIGPAAALAAAGDGSAKSARHAPIASTAKLGIDTRMTKSLAAPKRTTGNTASTHNARTVAADR